MRAKKQGNIDQYDISPKQCSYCGQILPYSKRTHKFCDSKCAGKVTGKKKPSRQTKSKIRAALLGRSTPAKGKQIVPRIWVECKCGIVFEKLKSSSKIWCSLICYGKHASERLLQQYRLGRKPAGGNTKWLAYNEIKVQGTYEFRMCHILDNWVSSGKILTWKYAYRRIPYAGLDGKTHTYIPDFLFGIILEKCFSRQRDML